MGEFIFNHVAYTLSAAGWHFAIALTCFAWLLSVNDQLAKRCLLKRWYWRWSGAENLAAVIVCNVVGYWGLPLVALFTPLSFYVRTRRAARNQPILCDSKRRYLVHYQATRYQKV